MHKRFRKKKREKESRCRKNKVKVIKKASHPEVIKNFEYVTLSVM